MEGSPFLPLPEGMLIDRVEQTDYQLTVTVVSTRAEAACPGCGCPSDHVVPEDGQRRSLWRPQCRATTLCAQVFLLATVLPEEGVCRAASRPSPALGQSK